MQEIEKLNIETDEKELVDFMRKIPLVGSYSSEVRTMFQNFAANLLNLKQQKKLLEDQKGSNKKLVIATWVLAGATIALAIITLILAIKG